LELLKGQTQPVGKGRLTQPAEHTANSNPPADMNVDRVWALSSPGPFWFCSFSHFWSNPLRTSISHEKPALAITRLRPAHPSLRGAKLVYYTICSKYQC
jgi:hypothetical protein